jgi:hypothetical protein
MNLTSKFLLACIPALCISACGGSDVTDRLDVSDPLVRFIDASESAPNLTLYRGTVAQSDATNVSYKFASAYFDVAADFADWTVKTAVGGVTVDSASIDASQGTKYTIVALPTSAVTTGMYIIADPYNKPIGSNSTRLRVMNARYDAGAIDVYMNALGTDIGTAGVNPLIAATAYKTSGPASGDDSVDIPAGTYQVTIAAAGTKTVLFQGQLAFGENKDILLVVLHDATVAEKAQTLFTIDGTGGLTQMPPL